MRELWFLAFLGLTGWHVIHAAADEPRRVDFSREVRPILERSCWKCHGPEKQNGGLRFDRPDGLLRAGDSGSKAVTPGRSDTSELIRRVEEPDAEQRMPPKSDPLGQDQIKILRAWIEQGANWPKTEPSAAPTRSEMVVTDEDRRHWSYRPLKTVALPTVSDSTWCRTPIDQFLFTALDAKGIHPNPPADRRALIRRVHFDVIGLPPAPEEVESFVADPAPLAYDALVDRLLASPHYGERWGRHWLDVARYADSGGMETDEDRPNAYHFRDFVIRALNEDLSFQKFVGWQLAGDEFEPDIPDALAATGFLTGAPNELLTDQHLEEERLRLRFNELDDMQVTTVAAFLGLTLGCARCHDHKFDAIPTRDYYRIQCAFTSTARGNVFLATRADVGQYLAGLERWNKQLQEAQSRLKDWLTDQQKTHTSALRNSKIDGLSASDEEKSLLKEKPDSEGAKKLAKRFEKSLKILDEDYRRVFSDEQRQRWDLLKQELTVIQRSKPTSPPTALGITELKREPEPTWLLNRGDFYSKKEPVQLGFLSVLTRSQSPADYWSAARRQGIAGPSTGQRRALADWMTDVDHGAGPLLARVMVNRIWQHHFGEGLVRTVSDFGVRGELPTHPELMEWLAHEFVAQGWQLKSLHRLILLSAAYQQSTTFDAGRAQLDPDNRLLWRRRPLRLESEILRDSVLAVSGTLNLQRFGPAFKPPIPREAMVARNTKDPYPQDAQDNVATRRRTVYMFHKRVVQHPLMQAFDGPDAAVSCSRRINTTVAPQALALMNDAFLRDRGADFAKRLLLESGTQPEDCVERGYRLALSRPPTETERMASIQFLSQQAKHRAQRDPTISPDESRLQTLTDYCQALFSLNEFVYVD